jgi:Uma2 family endonuclease
MPTTTIDREPAPKAAPPGPTAATLVLPHDVRLYVNPDDFERICAANRDLRLELQADGGLIVMSPASSDSSRRNLLLEVYRPGREAETLANPRELRGEGVLPGLALDLSDILS